MHGRDGRGGQGHSHEHSHQHDHAHEHGPGDGGDAGGSGGGSPELAFLDLEISQMLLGRATQVTKEAAVDLLREAVRERLRERVGDLLTAIGRVAADELADDMAANFQIEALIAERRQKASGMQERLQGALRGGGGGGSSGGKRSSRRKRSR